MRKNTYEEVKDIITKEGYILNSKEYVNNSTRLDMTCTKGHDCSISFANFKKGRRCKTCSVEARGRNRRYTHEDVKAFIESNGYKLTSRYVKSSEMLTLCCPLGHTFHMKFNNFQQGQRCPKCYEVNRKHPFQYVQNYIETEVGYQVMTEPYEDYVSSKDTLELKCPQGHTFNARYDTLKDGHRCPYCQTRRYTYDMVKKHIESEGYTLLNDSYINNYTPLNLICPKGHTWETIYRNFSHGYRCKTCNESRGERRVSEWLRSKEIEFIPQHSFDDCLYKYPLRFDFYIPSMNLIIEYDGRQHFEPIEYFGGEERFLEEQERDGVKNDYCINNGINMLRIAYYDYEEIDNILDKNIGKI